MPTGDVVLEQLQQQITALLACRQQQLDVETARAQAETDLRRKAAETTASLIKLNVGGTKYTTSMATLTAVTGAYFNSLFSGDWQQVLTAEGEVFLDRDGEVSRVKDKLPAYSYVYVLIDAHKRQNCCRDLGSS